MWESHSHVERTSPRKARKRKEVDISKDSKEMLRDNEEQKRIRHEDEIPSDDSDFDVNKFLEKLGFVVSSSTPVCRGDKEQKRVKHKEEKPSNDYDFDVNELLEEMGFVLPSSTPVCPIDSQILEKTTSQTGWEYFSCPKKNCCVFTGVDEATVYLFQAKIEVDSWYKDRLISEGLLCFCREPVQLYRCRAGVNLNRMYLKCQRGRCKLHQWTNLLPSHENQEWWTKRVDKKGKRA